jgi:hypothetical protein
MIDKIKEWVISQKTFLILSVVFEVALLLLTLIEGGTFIVSIIGGVSLAYILENTKLAKAIEDKVDKTFLG